MALSPRQSLINIIGPALRGLLADGPSLPIVSFDDSEEKRSATDVLRVDLPPGDAETPRIVEYLRSAVEEFRKSRQAAPLIVRVNGLGHFAYSPAGTSAGRVAGKVALVTGAARGFGWEIARDLVAQGALMAIADLNDAGARDCARHINEYAGRRLAISLAMDVANAESVASAVHEVVRAFGGLDILVSNAGILKAGSVKTLSPDDFDGVTRVNYQGYFHCVQHVAPIMAAQHIARPDWIGDIIQINSKSGLQGSTRNSAYSGAKFGGIGLTQSFALELIEDGIKVNAICPGNFFDGPLWSDPNNGLFVQYLRAGKVPGAKTIEDIRRFYEAKVPMGRGCRSADVMKAIYYLIEQQYETGQALPVTGGQVMLG